MKSAVTVSRRSLLGLAALALAACKKGPSPLAPRRDPDALALAAARASEAALIAAYDSYLSAIQGGPGAVSQALAQRSVHERHLVALGGSAASPSPSAAPSALIRPLLRSSASSLRSAAIAAIDGAHAATLASIAAAHEVMAHE